jgi:chromate transporter
MLGFIEQHAVTSFHWLTAQQFLDGLALGQLTPGPVVISTCHPELAAAGGGSAFRFGRNIKTWEDSK